MSQLNDDFLMPGYESNQADKGAPKAPGRPRRHWGVPFIVTAIVLAVAAVGINFTAAALQLHFRKQAVPLRKKLAEFPSKLGSWIQVSKDEPIDKDMEESLQTDQYLFRDYVNPDLIRASMDDLRRDMKQLPFLSATTQPLYKTPEELVNDISVRDKMERNEMIGRIRARCSEAVISLSITHYTDKADTVAHIPERCYLADGFDPTDQSNTDWKPQSAHFVTFENQDVVHGHQMAQVAYLFQCNGKYMTSSEDVRFTLQDLRCKYAYYTKIEMMNNVKNREVSGKRIEEFLTAALPSIEATLPDYSQYANR